MSLRNRGTDSLSESGIKWMSGSTKRQCDRAPSSVSTAHRKRGPGLARILLTRSLIRSPPRLCVANRRGGAVGRLLRSMPAGEILDDRLSMRAQTRAPSQLARVRCRVRGRSLDRDRDGNNQKVHRCRARPSDGGVPKWLMSGSVPVRCHRRPNM